MIDKIVDIIMDHEEFTSEESAQAMASDIEKLLHDLRLDVQARELLGEALLIVQRYKKESASEQERIDYGVLVYKIEELLIKL